MLLGLLLEDVDRIISADTFSHAQEIIPVLQTFVAMLSHPAQVEQQYAAVPGNMPRKLTLAAQLIGKFMRERTSPRLAQCLSAAALGLGVAQDGPVHAEAILATYTQAYADHYLPYFQSRQHIFENYLVNEVLTRLFPFTRGAYLDLYQEMVSNLAVLQVLLVGMAGHHRGLTDELVLQAMQTFARKATHSRDHLDAVLDILRTGPQDSFIHTMWLLKETG